MSETSEFDTIVYHGNGIPVYIGNEMIRLEAETTTIWRHGPESSHYDHCVVEIDNQPGRVFGLNKAALDDLAEGLGCRVIDTFYTADEETRAAYEAWVNGSLEDFGHTS